MAQINIIDAIGQNKLEEAVKALLDATRGTDKYNDIILQSGRLAALNESVKDGDITYEQSKSGRTVLRKALIETVKDCEMEHLMMEIKETSSNTTNSGDSNRNKSIKILFLAVNPRGTTAMRLGQEVRDLENTLKMSEYRDKFNVVSKWAVTPDELRHAMITEKPNIVHFSGHGESDGLVFEDGEGKKKPISIAAINGLFRLAVKRSPIQCVLLNACYSVPQAEGVAEHVDWVIGMKNAILDNAAIAFTKGFYDSLGAGDDYSIAFETGVVNIDLHGFQGADLPVLHKNKKID